MDIVTETQVTRIHRSHTFYCDKCNAEIGTEEETSDGYYEELGNYGFSIRLGDLGWFSLDAMTLCDKCAQEKNNEIIQALTALGFKED